jgi:S-formylglutathione hydrolase
MGCHGALISFFKRPAQYKSVSAFAPISSASQCEWSKNAFMTFFEFFHNLFIYFEDEDLWKQ